MLSCKLDDLYFDMPFGKHDNLKKYIQLDRNRVISYVSCIKYMK